jgi:hypothetical protein
VDDEVALVYTAKADKRERRSTTPKFYFGLAGGAGQPADFNASSSKCKCVVQVFLWQQFNALPDGHVSPVFFFWIVTT